MIIEGESFYDVELTTSESGSLHCSQQVDGEDTKNEKIIIDKKQAAQLIEVLQKWLAGEEVG